MDTKKRRHGSRHVWHATFGVRTRVFLSAKLFLATVTLLLSLPGSRVNDNATALGSEVGAFQDLVRNRTASLVPGRKAVVVRDCHVYSDGNPVGRVKLSADLTVAEVKDHWVKVVVSFPGDDTTDEQDRSRWVKSENVAAVEPILEHESVPRLQSLFRDHEYVQIRLKARTDNRAVHIRASGYSLVGDILGQLPGDAWSCSVRSEHVFGGIADFLVEQAEMLQECDVPDLADLDDEGDKDVLLPYHFPRPHQIKVGRSTRLHLSANTQRFFTITGVSDYLVSRWVLIVAEPHWDVAGHVALLKGLESLFAENPSLLANHQVIFLAEGYPANKPLSVQPLIEMEPRPSDFLINDILATYLIPGYLAYEWKHRHGIPIIGSEDAELYGICVRLHFSNWLRGLGYMGPFNPFAGDELMGMSVAARNQRIAGTLLAQLGQYECPILFIGNGHVGPAMDVRPQAPDESWPRFTGRLEPGELRRVKDAEKRQIADYLKKRGIGYCLLSARGDPLPDQQTVYREVARYFKVFEAQLCEELDSYVESVSKRPDSVTVSPTPELAAKCVDLIQRNGGGNSRPLGPPNDYHHNPDPDPPDHVLAKKKNVRGDEHVGDDDKSAEESGNRKAKLEKQLEHLKKELDKETPVTSGKKEEDVPKKGKKVGTSKSGDKVRTPESHRGDFVPLKGGQGYRNKYTGEIWKKVPPGTAHRGEEWDVTSGRTGQRVGEVKADGTVGRRW